MATGYVTISKTITKGTATSQTFQFAGLSAISRVCLQYKGAAAASNTSTYATGTGRNVAGSLASGQCARKPANSTRTYESILLKGVDTGGVTFQTSGIPTFVSSQMKGVVKTTGMGSNLVLSVTAHGTKA